MAFATPFNPAATISTPSQRRRQPDQREWTNNLRRILGRNKAQFEPACCIKDHIATSKHPAIELAEIIGLGASLTIVDWFLVMTRIATSLTESSIAAVTAAPVIIP